MPEVDVWRALARALESGRECAVLAVTDSRGSSPGRRGAVMAVGTTGPLAGTIGGGVAESRLVDQVAADLRAGSLAPRRVRLAHQEGATDASGMICGGSQVVVVAPLHDGQRADVAVMVEALAAGRPVTWSIDPNGWQILPEGVPRSHPGPEAPAWSSEVRSGPTHVVHVIGAGHVGSALVPLLVALDFRVVVVDERPGLAPLAADIGAHERVVRPYEELAGVVVPGPTSFAAIMTHSHERDTVALGALEPLELGYLGLLGSRAKVRRIVGERVMPAWFHAPMGLPIASATPAEIAVSIAAERVSVRGAARRDTTG